MSGKVRPEEAVQATLSSLPDEVVDTVGITSLPSEDSLSERRRKLDFLEMQEELIKVDELFTFAPMKNCLFWSETFLHVLMFPFFSFINLTIGGGRETGRRTSQEK